MDIKQVLEERFIRYVNIDTQSDASQTKVPSTDGQTVLANLLADELRQLGVQDVLVDEHSIVTAIVPGLADKPKMGFVAHLDTVDVGLCSQVHPQKIHYTGQEIILNQEKGLRFDKTLHPEVDQYLGDDIFFSDGTSVLGADNKAAICVVMSAVDTILREDLPHGDLYIAFVPDEEIGLRGAKKIDLTRFCPDYAYTIDCCAKGEVVFETFNAGTAFIDIKGVTAHPMSAKNVLVNPILVAHDIISQFDRQQTPEHTEGTEGYIWFNAIHGTQSATKLQASIRDHDLEKYQSKKQHLIAATDKIQQQYPTAEISIDIEDVYANISNNADKNHPAVAAIYHAMEQLDIQAETIAMRGGTDGSALSAKGLVTPNYFTGAHNFHSKYEFLPMSSLLSSYELTLTLIANAAQ